MDGSVFLLCVHLWILVKGHKCLEFTAPQNTTAVLRLCLLFTDKNTRKVNIVRWRPPPHLRYQRGLEIVKSDVFSFWGRGTPHEFPANLPSPKFTGEEYKVLHILYIFPGGSDYLIQIGPGRDDTRARPSVMPHHHRRTFISLESIWSFAVNNVLQPDAQVSPFAFWIQSGHLFQPQPLQHGCCQPRLRLPYFFRLLPQNSSRRKHKCCNHGSNHIFVYSNCRMFHTRALFSLWRHTWQRWMEIIKF